MSMSDFDPDFASSTEWAHAYRGLRLNAIPASGEKKHPLQTWKTFQQELVPQTVFDGWYGPNGSALKNPSLGILTGPCSLEDGAALLVIDVDVKDGAGGAETWQAWLDEHENGQEPDTWKARTGSGGRHLYFRYPARMKIYNTQATFKGIDVRAEGGFVVAPPSRHYLPGKVYVWDFSPLDDGCTIADAPEWLLNICAKIGQDEDEAKVRPRSQAERVQAVEDINAWGKRTNGREAYMTRVVWGTVLDLYRDAPIKPPPNELMDHMLAAYTVYVDNVRTRLPCSNEEGLEREGRGLSYFQEKWDRAIAQWDGKVREEAGKPNPTGGRAPERAETPAEVAAAKEVTKGRIELIAWDDLPDVKVDWLIKDFLPSGGFAALFGKPGSYKSFVALYLAACIATGQPAFGRATVQGDVIYIAGEGGAGLKKRRDAFMRKYDLAPGTRVHFIRAQLNLRSTDADVDALVEVLKARGLNPTLIIIDTLARAFAGGNENASEDMGGFIRQTGRLQEALNHPAVMIVHHCGKDEARGMRGHSSLFAAIDTELEVIKLSAEGSDNRTGKLTVTKQKDGEDDYSLTYRLELVVLSPITGEGSLVVVPDDAIEVKPQIKLTANQETLLEALRMALDEAGQTIGLEQIPQGQRCVRIEMWRKYFNQISPQDEETRRKTWNRTSPQLRSSGTVKVWGEWAWLA